MSKKEHIYIVSGTYEEYKQYRQKKFNEFLDQPPTQEFVEFPEYHYIQHVGNLLGLVNPKGFYIGTYKDRPDLPEIELAVKIAKSKRNPIPNPTKIP